MKLTAAQLVSDALRLLRRDRAVLVAVAGLFWFLPAYAIVLLVPEPPRAVEPVDMKAYTQVVAQWLTAQAPWYLLDFAATLWGGATLYLLYGDPGGPTVREAIARGAGLGLRLLLATAAVGVVLLPLAAVLAALPGGVGLLPWTLGTLFVVARLLPIGPALAAERPLSTIGAVVRAWRLSRGGTMPLIAVAAALLGVGWLVSEPFALAENWVRAHGGNPVAVAIAGAGEAMVSAAVTLGSALTAVCAYRRLAR